MALQGTIDTFELPDVIRLLATGKKTGCLRLSGDRGVGRLCFSDGRMVGARFADRAEEPPAEVLFELLRFSEGSFTFSEEDVDPVDAPEDVDVVIMAAEASLAEWHEISKVVPSISYHARLESELERSDVVIDRDGWRVVAAVGGGSSIEAIGFNLEMNELAICRAMKGLIELGLVELSEPTEVSTPDPAPAATPSFDEPVEPASPVEDAFVAPDPLVDGFAAPIDPQSTPFDPQDAAGFDAPDLETRAQLDALASDFGLDEAVAPSPPPAPAPAPMPPATLAPDPVPGPPDLMEEFNAEPAPTGEDLFERDPIAADGAGGSDPLFADGTPAASPGDAAEVARQLANLSPDAARAVAAAARATTDEEREAALADATAEGGEPINRELLMKFLSSVQA